MCTGCMQCGGLLSPSIARWLLKDFHVFCVDVSPSMGQPGRHGDSHLETSLKVMNQVVQQKVLLVLCGWEVWGHSAG